MSEQKTVYNYRLSGNVVKFERVRELALGLSGVVSAELEGDCLSLELEHAASEYEIFSALYSAAEANGVELDYAEEEAEAEQDQGLDLAEEEEELEEEEEEDSKAQKRAKKAADAIPEEEKKWSKKYVANIAEVAISAILMIIVACVPTMQANTRSFMCLIAFAVVGYEIIWDAVTAVMRKQFLSPSLAMVLTVVPLMFLTDYLEVAFITLLFEAQLLLGKVLGDVRMEKVKAKLFFDFIRVQTGDEESVFAKDFPVGASSTFVIGNVLPFDGKITEGSAEVDYYNVTGVHKKEAVNEGDTVYGGGMVTDGEIKVRVEKTTEESLAGRMYGQMVNSADKTALDQKIQKYTKYAFPITLVLALVMCFAFPAFLGGGLSYAAALPDWCYKGVVFFGITNAFVFGAAYEINYKSALYRALSMGTYINSEQNLAAMAECDTAIFSEPGSLTEEGYKVGKIAALPAYKGRVLDVLKEFDLAPLELLEEETVIRTEGERTLVAGSYTVLKDKGLSVKRSSLTDIVRYVAVDGEIIGAISFKEDIKPTAYGAIRELKDAGVRSVVLAKGPEGSLSEIADVAEIYEKLSKDGKQNVISEIKAQNNKFVYAGVEGLGASADAQILFSDPRVSLGDGCGAIQPNGEVKAVAKAIKLAKRLNKIAKFNVGFALVMKLVSIAVGVLLIYSFSMTSLWIPFVIDAAVSALCMANAARNAMEVA